MVKPVVEKKYTLGERIYLLEILKGMVVTWKHFVFNVRASFRQGPHTVPTTWQYPEDRREIAPVFRGEHMHMLDEEGREKCIGCGICAKICPAKCITVVSAKVSEDQQGLYAGKTYAASFDIDLLRCIFCGFCEEACPKNALVLGQGYELARYTKEECHLTKERLLENYRRAKESGTLKPLRKPVIVAEPKAKPVPSPSLVSPDAVPKKAGGEADAVGAKIKPKKPTAPKETA
ncbi:MAG: NuoI/complex I 23 kDa subunit family protein [Dissulfurimicrobium sp.]|uniref:NuoI/complex I 23 kDa subunit family protein n=1 Tax=Dissulfurimicrobium sp. TaxID=2022436 RepID=UPI004049EAA2